MFFQFSNKFKYILLGNISAWAVFLEGRWYFLDRRKLDFTIVFLCILSLFQITLRLFLLTHVRSETCAPNPKEYMQTVCTYMEKCVLSLLQLVYSYFEHLDLGWSFFIIGTIKLFWNISGIIASEIIIE